MVKIRLMRAGRKKLPFYRIVAIDSRRPRDGVYLDLLGFLNPLSKDKQNFSVNIEKFQYWLARGSSMTERVKSVYQKALLNLEHARAHNTSS